MSASTWIFMILTLVFYLGGFGYLFNIMIHDDNK